MAHTTGNDRWGSTMPPPSQSYSGTGPTTDKAALLLFRDDGDERRLLFVTSPAKPYWLFPGGKRERGETIEAALRRELREELSIDVSSVRLLGEVQGHTPEGAPLRMWLFAGEPQGRLRAANEIDGLVWVSLRELPHHADKLTPITTDEVLPFLTSCGLW